MPIESTYKSVLLEEYIKDQLEEGESPTLEEFIAKSESLDLLDLTRPQFDFSKKTVSTEHEVVELESASAFKLNNTFSAMRQDLNILYKEVVVLSKNAVNMYDHWKQKAESLEKELIDLEEQVENLLLLSADTEGYHSVLVDNFTDLFSVDLGNQVFPLVDAKINTSIGEVVLGPSSLVPTQIFTNNLDINNIVFRIRSSVSSRSDMPGTDVRSIFKETSLVWHTVLRTEKVKPVVCELIVKLADLEEDAVSLNKILLILHDSGNSGSMNITPLYSTDDVTYDFFDMDDISKNITDSGSFYFPNTDVRLIKFILSKSSPDPSSSDVIQYQFGFKQIKFFKESYIIADKQIMESKWLYSLDTDEDILEFEKLTLEACETIPTGTSIEYYIATEDDVSNSPSPLWYPITPINRDEILDSTIFEIGSTSSESIAGMVHYDSSSANASYTYLNSVGGSPQVNPLTGEDNLYAYINPNTDSILNHLLYNESDQSLYPLILNESSLVLYRGVGNWKLEDPHYFSIVEIKRDSGLILKTGNQKISIDNNPQQSGDITIPYGIHKIRIHKHSFNTDSNSLKTLIESGADFLAAIRMEKVSVFDMLNNVADTNYNKFAIDLSLPGYKPGVDQTVKKVFIVKKDPDNLSETFTVKFKLINKLRKYVKVKAELTTTDPELTPSLDGYQIKLA